MMRVIRQATSLVIIILLCAGIAHPQKRCTNLAPHASVRGPAATQTASTQSQSSKQEQGQKLLIVADNQEHVLTGVQLFSMALLSEVFLSSTAMRPPLAHVGGRLVLGEALRFGKRQGIGTVLHLGDATNISCRDEITSVFNTLDKEAVDENGKAMWFMAPGNHDGMLAGNLAGHQPPLNYQLTEDEVKDFYSEQRRVSQIHKQKAWLGACLSLSNWKYDPSPKMTDSSDQPIPAVKDSTDKHPADMLKTGILTRGDAIKLYVERLLQRERFPRVSSWTEEIRVEDTDVTCDVQEIKLKSHNYTAIASICRLTKLKNNPKTDKWVGPFASHIVQKLEIGGTPIILLDTSDYDNPSIFQVPFKGELTPRQKTHANYLLFGKKEEDALDLKNRDKIIIAGHHPISDFPQKQQRWIAQRTSRYLSAHVHTSTKQISHNLSEQLRTVELNVASTLDYPQQAVIAKITPPAAMSFRVVEAGGLKTGSPGILERCAKEKDWELPAAFYKGYWRGTYVNRLLDSLDKAAERAPTGTSLNIPSGKSPDDWRKLENVLNDINNSEGHTRAFWACQSYYASRATGADRSVAEHLKSRWGWVKARFRRSTKSECDAATGDWFSFSPPVTGGRS